MPQDGAGLLPFDPQRCVAARTACASIEAVTPPAGGRLDRRRDRGTRPADRPADGPGRTCLSCPPTPARPQQTICHTRLATNATDRGIDSDFLRSRRRQVFQRGGAQTTGHADWSGLLDPLGDLLPGLVGASARSIRRYRSGQRHPPTNRDPASHPGVDRRRPDRELEDGSPGHGCAERHEANWHPRG